MFSTLKQFGSNIHANYTVSSQVTSTAGAWKIYDATSKKTKKPCSVFVFDKKSLDAHGNSLGRAGAAAFKRTTDEVVERLRKEVSSLARLRHPNVLELVEPIEETRGGGLQFVTEHVTASLSSLLAEKDEQEAGGGAGGRSSRYVTEDADGTRRRTELEIDELEIQKGLLQVSKALEFLHENAGLVHGNLTPDAVLINAKSDWKISGLAFSSPPDNSTKPSSVQAISLSEALNIDPRLPHHVQLDLDYTSPDFVLDSNLTTSADMFSLGLLCVALYNSPHRSPIRSNASVSTYKRVFSSSSTVPSAQNGYLSSRPLPKDLAAHVLPRLITRRPAQRMTAREFQASEYFDNVLVSTIRFLESFPAKSPTEKSSFMRGLNKVLPSFPKSVMEKKVLPALLEELKEKDLLSLILLNIFKIVDLLPSSKRAFGERVRPRLKEIFVDLAKQPQEKDTARDAGLMVVLEHTSAIANNCNGKEFKDDILPVLVVAFESPTPALVDAAMRSLPVMLPVLDFSTIKNELFPVVAAVFSKTNSLAIKVRGLQAFVILCGGSADSTADDGLNGFGVNKKKVSSSSALDKYTMQEKIVPLIKVIKTKEPAVAMSALHVLRVIGDVADADFVAMEILPILWSMSLGPLLNLKQFQAFIDLIKSLSRRVEEEQTRKLQDMSAPDGIASAPNDDFMSFGRIAGPSVDSNGASEDDFERLVKGKTSAGGGDGNTSGDIMDSGWAGSGAAASRATSPPTAKSQPAAAFSWSSPSPTKAAPNPPGGFGVPQSQSAFRTVTPDLNRYETLSPSSTQFSKPLQPMNVAQSAANAPMANPWATTPSTMMSPPSTSMSGMSLSQQRAPTLAAGSAMSSSFTASRPAHSTSQTPTQGFSLPAPPGAPLRTGSSSSTFGAIPSSSSTFGQSSSFGGGMASMKPNSMNALKMGGGGFNNNNNTLGMGGGINSMMAMGAGAAATMTTTTTSFGGAFGQQQQQQNQQNQQQYRNQQGAGSGLDNYGSLI